MEGLLRRWLKGKAAVALKDIRRDMGKPAMDLFIINYRDWDYAFCMECNMYVRKRIFDDLNDMCLECKDRIEKRDLGEDDDEPFFGSPYEQEEGSFDELTND